MWGPNLYLDLFVFSFHVPSCFHPLTSFFRSTQAPSHSLSLPNAPTPFPKVVSHPGRVVSAQQRITQYRPNLRIVVRPKTGCKKCSMERESCHPKSRNSSSFLLSSLSLSLFVDRRRLTRDFSSPLASNETRKNAVSRPSKLGTSTPSKMATSCLQNGTAKDSPNRCTGSGLARPSRRIRRSRNVCSLMLRSEFSLPSSSLGRGSSIDFWFNFFREKA